MVTLKKAHVKIVSVLIALVFMGSVVALALTQTNGIASAAPASNVGVVDYQQFATLKIVTDVEEQMQKEAQAAQEKFNAETANMNDQQKQEYYQQTMQRLQQQHTDLMDPVRKQIEDAVKQVADAQGLSVVIQKDAVVYGGKDITQDVIKKLNK